jgi:cell division protein FtsX
VIRKPFQFVASVTLLLLFSGCGLLNDGSTDQDGAGLGAGRATESESTEAQPTLEDIAVLGEALRECRSTAVILEGVIWLRLGVEVDEVADLDAFLAASPSVNSFRYVDEQETFETFEEFFADEPEMAGLVTPDSLPTTFEVTFDEGADTAVIVSEIEAFGVVDDVELDSADSVCSEELAALVATCTQPTNDLLVWLEPGVDQTTVDAVASSLASSPVVSESRYVGPDETLAEFQDLFVNNPEVLDLMDKEDLPTSFEVTPSDKPGADEPSADEDWERQIDQLRTALEAIDGVDDVVDLEFAASPLTDACRAVANG